MKAGERFTLANGQHVVASRVTDEGHGFITVDYAEPGTGLPCVDFRRGRADDES